jgi:uncharacterized damage-inducible protein DinB
MANQLLRCAPRWYHPTSRGIEHQASRGTHTRHGPGSTLDKNQRRARASRQKDETPVPDLSSLVASSLAGYYEEVRGRLHQWVAPLSTDQLWRKPYSYGNSIGHLLLHLTGNLNYYIGAQIAGTGYVRERPREFNDPNPPSKEEAFESFENVVAMVLKTIGNQTPEDWSREYSGVGSDAKNRFEIVVICAAHMQHHIGQMIYLGCELRRQAKDGTR